MTPAADNGYRERLRGVTGSAHVRLDARFAHGLRDAQEYATYLVGMQAFLANAEQALALAELGSAWRQWREPLRTAWIDDDLRALELAPLAAGPALVVSNDAEAAGLLYVLEGSALGATQLVTHAQALGHAAGEGATFLHRHGGLGVGVRWRSFVRCLENAAFEASEESAMMIAAARAFASAEHEFHRAELSGRPVH
jgi:heme oxygenase